MTADRIHRGGIVLAVITALALVPNPACAKTLEEAMRGVASQIKGQLRKADAERVLVTLPDGPALDGAASLMRKTFVDALEEQAKVKVTKVAPDFKLSLEYSRAPGTSRYSAEVTLKDKDNQSVGKFPVNFEFDDVADRAAIEGANVDNTLPPAAANPAANPGAGNPNPNPGAGNPNPNPNPNPASANLPPGTQPATKDNALIKLAEKSNAFVEPKPGLPADSEGNVPAGTIVSAQQGSLFRIEILVKQGPGYIPRGVSNFDGVPFTELTEGEVYGVKVHNGAPHDVAVDLSIDGVNMWALSANEGFRQLGKFIVPAKSSTLIRGWHIGAPTIDRYEEFRVVLVPDSVVAELGVGESAVGQIQAQFFAAGDSPNLPGTEPIGAQSATGRGAPIEQPTTVRRVFIGQSLLAAVTVRYARPDIADLPPGEAP